MTHVLLPVLALLRRLDLAAVIGETPVARYVERWSRVEVTAPDSRRRHLGAAFGGPARLAQHLPVVHRRCGRPVQHLIDLLQNLVNGIEFAFPHPLSAPTGDMVAAGHLVRDP
jgi:hypothetical protein